MDKSHPGADGADLGPEVKMSLVLRQVRIWVSDARAPGFDEQCALQVQRIRDAEASETFDDASWFDTSDKTGWT